jgi:hypothetical protein
LLNFPNGGDVAFSGVGNTVFGNLFIDNSEQVLPNEIEFENINMGSRGTDIVLWDNGTVGNYWSNYNGTDANLDGVGDTPYIIDDFNQDNYALMNQVDISEIPEFLSWTPILLMFSIVAVAVVIYKRKLPKIPAN